MGSERGQRLAPSHTVTIEFDGDRPFFSFVCNAPADALCHAEWSCACETWGSTEVRSGKPAHLYSEYDEDYDTESEAWHTGDFDPAYCVYREWFDNSDDRVNGTITVPVKPEWHGDYYTFEIAADTGSGDHDGR